MARVTLYLLGVYLTSSFIEGSPDLLLANRRDVQIIDAEEPHADPKVVLNHYINAVNVDFLYDKQELFVSDLDIQRIWLNQSRDSETIVTELDSYKSLACDWLTEKLYVVDPDLKRVEVVTFNGKYRKVLIWERLDKPRSVALDPRKGWMFLTDWGAFPKIERCGMDGNPATRSVIVNRGLKWPNGITVDYDQSTIYWTDAGLHKIKSCNYNGYNKRTIIDTNLPHPFGISIHNERLYWTDWITRSVYSCDKTSGENRNTVARNKYSLMDIRVFSAERQPPRGTNVTNACDLNNGGCSHLCLLSPIRPFYTCACPTGIKLLQDQRTCADESENYVLIARQRDLRIMSQDTPDLIDINLPIKGHRHVVAITYDSVDKHVYWADDEIGTIRRSYLDGTGLQDVVNTDLLYPESITVDWIAGNLYFIDSGMETIEVTRLDGSFRKVLITENLDAPRAICVDPVNGYMFWTDWGSVPKIERANMDGSGRTVIINSSLTWPNGIAVDHTKGKIYWGDGYEYKIEEADFDGTNRRTIFSGQFIDGADSRIFGFSLLGDHIYWTDRYTETLERVNRKTGVREIVLSERQDMMDVVAVKRNGLEGTNDCAIRNGGCSHLCLMRPGRHICACPSDQVLDRSRTNCITPYTFRRGL